MLQAHHIGPIQIPILPQEITQTTEVVQQEAGEAMEEEGKEEAVVEGEEEEVVVVVTIQDLVGDLVLSHIKAGNHLGNYHQGLFTFLDPTWEKCVENAHKKIISKRPQNTF